MSAGFERGTNVELVTIRDARTLDVIVWERGVGRTLACGTGACAVAVAAARARARALRCRNRGAPSGWSAAHHRGTRDAGRNDEGTRKTGVFGRGPGAVNRDANDPRHDLNVVAIVSSAEAIELMSRTLSPSSDRLSVATDLAEGLVRISSQVPDVAFVDVTLGDGAGLAVLHHIRALAPNVTVFALTTADRLALGMQAAALGSAGTLVMPLSGDELLNALSDVRTRMVERTERLRLERVAAASKRHASLVEQVAEIAESATRREAADRLAEVLVSGVGVRSAAVVRASRRRLRAS